MQQPSSLIFLAIIVIWGAYLLQHWIRRREALATARSVDEFTEAMRVLERRDPLPEGIAKSEDSSHASRPPAPQVSVKQPRPSLRAGTVMTGEAQRPTSDHGPAASSTASPASGASAATTATTATARMASAAQSSLRGAQQFGSFAARSGSPKLRAGALIACVAILLITIICTPFGALPWWSPLLALVASAGVLWWCRESAKAAAAERRAMAPKRAPRPAVRQTRNVEATPVRARMPKAPAKPGVAQSVARQSVAQQAAPQQTVAQQAAARRETVFDVTAATAPEAPVATSTPAPSRVEPQLPAARTEQPAPATQEAAADGWQPVAVPRPTYAMKEKAPERPAPQPAATVASQPAPAAAYEHVPTEDLPFDGLALDQDLEELPSVYRAG